VNFVDAIVLGIDLCFNGGNCLRFVANQSAHPRAPLMRHEGRNSEGKPRHAQEADRQRKQDCTRASILENVSGRKEKPCHDNRNRGGTQKKIMEPFERRFALDFKLVCPPLTKVVKV